MMLHKIFHVHMPVDQARERLNDIESYSGQLPGVRQADFTGHGLSHWRLVLPFGVRARMVLSEIQAEEANTTVFKSLDGNVEVFGILSFQSIRPNLTEVDVMVDYQFRSPGLRMLDRVFHFGDQFIVKQLRSIRAHFEGSPTPAPKLMDVFGQGLRLA